MTNTNTSAATPASADLDKLEALAPQLRGAARQLRQYLKLAAGTAHWTDSQQSSACDEAAGIIEQARRAAQPVVPADDLHIGVSNNDQGVHINIMQRHADGSATTIYAGQAPRGDSYGRAALVLGPSEGGAGVHASVQAQRETAGDAGVARITSASAPAGQLAIERPTGAPAVPLAAAISMASAHLGMVAATDRAMAALNRAAATEALSAALWLYWRLPLRYGRPAHIEVVIERLAHHAGADVADFLAKRGTDTQTKNETQGMEPRK